MALDNIPAELVFLIAKNIDDQKDLNSLALTCRLLYNVFNDYLYTHNVKHRGGDGLITAAGKGSKTAVEYFLNKGADPNIQIAPIDKAGYVPADAFPHGYNPKEWLVVYNPDFTVWKAIPWTMNDLGNDESQPYHGRTPLLLALKHGYTAVAEVLLAYDKVKLHMVDPSGRTAMHLAASHGLERIVTMLLARGCDINAQDRKEDTPLHSAVKAGHVQMTDFILNCPNVKWRQQGISGGPFHVAVMNGHTQLVQMLLSRGMADYTTPVHVSHSALFFAVQGGYETTVRLLLDQGHLHQESVDIVWLAERREGMMDVLLEAVKKKTLRITHPSYGLGFAARRKSVKAMEILLAHEDINPEQICSKKTPLSIAAENGNLEIMQMLLDTGKVDVNYRDVAGNTPLFYAAKGGREAVDFLLAQEGIIREPVNNDGLTPAHYALIAVNQDLCRYLKGGKKMSRELENLLYS
ncbi:hypothetical protein AWENTII_012020 [Aspergillus wentii]